MGSDEAKGWPIYQDSVDRGMSDPACMGDSDWYPATPPTQKLWRCYAALRKVHSALEGVSPDLSGASLTRFLINFATPLDDLFVCIRDLPNGIEGDPDTRKRLTSDELQFVRTLRTRYEEAVIQNNGPVKAVRDKLGAHTDKSLRPDDAAKLVQQLDKGMIGACLHAAMLALDQFARLDCFAWSSKGYEEGQFRLMACEPFVINLAHDCSLPVGFEFSESPRRHLFELIGDVIEGSEWMFPDRRSPLRVRRAAAQSK